MIARQITWLKTLFKKISDRKHFYHKFSEPEYYK